MSTEPLIFLRFTLITKLLKLPRPLFPPSQPLQFIIAAMFLFMSSSTFASSASSVTGATVVLFIPTPVTYYYVSLYSIP